MQAVLFPSAMRSDKTIATAWTVLALFGAAQLFAVAFHYAGRSAPREGARNSQHHGVRGQVLGRGEGFVSGHHGRAGSFRSVH